MNMPAIPLQQVYEYLDRAEQLLRAPNSSHSKPNSWVQNSLAVDHEGRSCEPHSDLAVAYCEIGAVKAVTHYDNNPDAAYSYVVSVLHAANPMAISKITGANNMGGIPCVNDSATSFDTIIKMFQRAKLWVVKQGHLDAHVDIHV